MKHYVPISTIIDTVAKHYGIDPVLMFGSPRRQRHISTPRHVAMYLARRLTCMSLQAVADAFLVSDHTTVIYAERKVQRWVRDGELDVEGLEAACVERSEVVR